MEIDLGSFVVRSYRPGDARSLAAVADNPRITAMLRDRFPQPYTEQDARDYIEHATHVSPEVQFAIARGGEVLGAIGFRLLDDIERLSSGLGFFLGEPHWGQGITTTAIQALVDYAFATLDIIRVYAHVFASNPASARVLHKCGFALGGTLRRAAIKADRILHIHVYSHLQVEPT